MCQKLLYFNPALALTGPDYNKLASVEPDPIRTQYLLSDQLQKALDLKER